MPEQSQGFTLTKDVGRGFILRSTLSIQWAEGDHQSHMFQCSLFILQPSL
jgi:hypothetical protein